MIILDKPFVSEFLKDTIAGSRIKLLKTSFSENLTYNGDVNAISEKDAIEFLNKEEDPLIYTNSENSINWILKNIDSPKLIDNIKLFKDKFLFRKLLKNIYPDFYFQELKLDEIFEISTESIPKPFIIKPSKGFFSMGVHLVRSNLEWESVKGSIRKELEMVKNIYPVSVLDTSSFILEEYIQGDEYAFDAYFNVQGKPVILNVFKHLFSNEKNLNDRVYYTSASLVEEHLDSFREILKKVGELTDIRNFPMHVEVRITSDGRIIPIEINPMRFGGWCTTADISFNAFNFNPYVYYLSGLAPDWEGIIQNSQNKTYCIIVLDNTTGQRPENIASFNFNKLCERFEKPLEIRVVDYKEFPVFGFLFAEIQEEKMDELEFILESNLREFIEMV
ncbi:MAG: ATP-grasp domain-containing protein [Bacteroidales bacterium]|nr:ATP-grasp domain-containing protein [Bacteroidales bacterium]